MGTSLRIFLFVVILIYFFIIINLLRKKSLNLRYSLIWLASGFVLMVLIVFPKLIYVFSEFVGIATPVNTVFVVEGIFILLILLSLTTIVSHFNERNRKLVQTVALLEKRIRELEKNKE